MQLEILSGKGRTCTSDQCALCCTQSQRTAGSVLLDQASCSCVRATVFFDVLLQEGEPPRSSLAHLQSKCQPAFIWRRLFTLLWAAFIWTVTFGAMVTAMFSADEVQMPMFLDVRPLL